ncbi:hypothetical protein PRZ48_009488 [Zasmidium cellare]|uniref:Carboxymuconolactone decarboxylase-like domain-containing protein n=1 Tax=Zasmidium cellare TaxID=395010 RepID=A0ABR0EBW9_ZASCE|nr:hypothetical protein PRZ48_009488 [Zasmidium cellare]
MNRLGLMHPSTLTGKHNAETSALYNALTEHTTQVLGGASITYKLPSTGALVGPFGILLHTPHVGRAFLDFCNALFELPGLTDRTRTIIALVVAAYENSNYHFYFNGRLAQERGMTKNELDSLRAGLYAQSFSEEEKAAYGVARELCASSGNLSERAWSDCVSKMGKEGTVALVHYVGFHRYIATMLRGFDAQMPAPRERVENQGVGGAQGGGGGAAAGPS